MLDVVLRGGLVVDGTGRPGVNADVGIEAGRITQMAPSLQLEAREVVDVSGLTITPGFVDMHVHADLQLMVDPDWACEIDQGVTTVVIGQDGLGLAPITAETGAQLRRQLQAWNGDPDLDWDWRSIDDYLTRLAAVGPAPNVAMLVPHGTVRMLVIGLEDRPARPEEVAAMARIVAQGMEEGAVGLSAGLMYSPSITASDEELVALCRELAPYGGYYQPHHRNYGAGALKGYADSIAIGKAAGIPVQLTHAHLSFAPNKGRHAELLAMVDDSRAAGVDVTLDSYPYLAGSTSLHAFLPSWAQSGGVDALISRLQDPALRARMRQELEVTGSDGLSLLPVEWDTLVLSNASRAEHRRFIGLSMLQGAEQEGQGKSPFDFYADLVAAERGAAGCLLFCGHEENVRAIMQHPSHMAGSDGLVMGDRPHPRAWGTFTRYLAHYVGELGLLSFEEMVRKMTALPAQRLGLHDRGVVKVGAAADLVILDRGSLADRSSYEEPRGGPSGVRHVLVNGAFTRRDGRPTGSRSGRVLRRHRSAHLV